MNRFLIVVGLLLVIVVGLGFYFEYLRFSSESSDGVTHFTLTVDQKRAQGDGKKALENVPGKSNASP